MSAFRKVLATVLFVISLIAFIFFTISFTKILWTDQGSKVGPHDSVRVKTDQAFYTKEPPASIYITSTCNFVLVNKDTQETITATATSPQLGETGATYIVSGEIDGSKYQVGLCGASIFSENDDVVIFVENSVPSKVLMTFATFLGCFGLLILSLGGCLWIYGD